MPESTFWWQGERKVGATVSRQSARCHFSKASSRRTSVPVLAAGGISTSRGLAAVLAAGASGAWLGTAFAVCPESLSSDAARSALVAAKDTATVTTSVFDVALGYPWPAQYPERVLRNGFWERWKGREEQLAEDPEADRRLQSFPRAGTGTRLRTRGRRSRGRRDHAGSHGR